jgi:hypothetical protein
MFSMYEQMGTYLLGSPKLESIQSVCLVAPVVRFKKTEKITEVYERNLEHCTKGITNHIIQRNYYRNEFDFELIKRKAKMIALEIAWYLKQGAEIMDPKYYWYQNRQGCYSPFECEFLPICKSGVVPENLYEKREIH